MPGRCKIGAWDDAYAWNPHLEVEELERPYRAAKEPHERSRWHILWLLARGLTATAVARVKGYSAYWIGQIARRYDAGGPKALRDGRLSPRGQCSPLLTRCRSLVRLPSTE